MEKYSFNGLMVLMLSLISLNSMAQTRAFKIELLVFAQDKPTSEVFDQYESQIEWPKQLGDRIDYQKVAVEHMRLDGINATLRRSAGYRPLMHVAWTQEFEPNRVGTAVHIQNQDGSINGFFRIQRGHLLHMITDLEYSPDGARIYRLNEIRKFKFKEIHYVDHPKFGLIARVSPVPKNAEM